MQKGFEMWGWNTGHVDLDPKTAGWPHLSFYVNFVVQHVVYAAGRLTGRYGNALDYFVDHAEVATRLVPARFVNVLAGALLVLVGVRLARRLTGTFGAVLAGLILSLSPLLTTYSLKVAPDGLLALFSALALACLVDVAEKGRWRDYLGGGLFLGLGAAAKYTPVLLVPALLAAHLIRQEARLRSLAHPRLLASAAAAAAAFMATTPYTVLDFAIARRDFTSQVLRLAGEGHFGHELQRIGWVAYLTGALPQALGWPAVVAGIVGAGIAVVRRRGAWWVVALAFLGFYGVLGALRSSFPHYMLPALLPLTLGVAALGREVVIRARPGGPLASRALPAAFAVLVLAPLPPMAAREYTRYSRTTTNNEALAFILHDLAGPDVTFASEIGGPELPRSPMADYADRGVMRRLTGDQRSRLLDRPFVQRYILNLYMSAPEGADAYYDLRHYLHYDYVVVSGKAHDRYVALKDEFPRQNRFYDDLREYAELVRHVPAEPDRLGPDVWIYRIVPGTRRILTDRGPLEPGFLGAHPEKVRLPDLQAFLSFTGGVAMQDRDFGNAALYLDALLAVSPDRRDSLLLPVAKVMFQAGDLDGAARHCREFLQRHPQDAEARALAAAIAQAPGTRAALPSASG